MLLIFASPLAVDHSQTFSFFAYRADLEDEAFSTKDFGFVQKDSLQNALLFYF
ncbi:hypothetical protein M127_5445 [Bacteroides fragilis str. S6L5]|nr:hypothetical protein M127_5445 [Bacteroides fragilis str. S6L5]